MSSITRFVRWTPLTLIFMMSACSPSGEHVSTKYQIVSEIKKDRNSPFFLDIKHYPKNLKNLPVGVFDSGTGGLTVLDAIIHYDHYNNITHKPGADGVPDFQSESFEYLADDANMPYGRYDAEGKAGFLRELVIKDVRFLLGRSYYLSPEDSIPETDKQPVKTIVIACNTATAFGLETVREAMREWGLDIKILGIIDAGSKRALKLMKSGEEGVIGILATEGTCASEGYPRAIKKYLPEFLPGTDVPVIQQAGIGLAGAIDGDKNYIDPEATKLRFPENYKGPDIWNLKYPVNPTLVKEYNFDTGNALLTETDQDGVWTSVQLNSVSNYIKYMVTNMVLQMAARYPDRQLKEVILGCTHYPYYTDEIREHFLYLKTLNEVYDKIIPAGISFIDPAESLAGELFETLDQKDMWGMDKNENSRFFISVPNVLLKQNKLDEEGGFPYSYKYGRQPNRSLQYVKIVPFSTRCVKESVRTRMAEDLPGTYSLIPW